MLNVDWLELPPFCVLYSTLSDRELTQSDFKLTITCVQAFTPGVVRECETDKTCRWYLFYGGVNHPDPTKSESIGVTIATSPWGPFVRWEGNPVFRPTDPGTAWCPAGRAARVDEIKPSLIGGIKYFAVKATCSGFQALPILYSPANQSSWGPPYIQAASPAVSPMFPINATCGHEGFEQPTLFKANDTYLHFVGHNHGKCPLGSYSHYISRTGTIDEWIQAPEIAMEGESIPVPLAGDGVFGQAIFKNWIDFAGFTLNVVNTSMAWSNATKIPS